MEFKTDWTTENIVARRDKYYAASQRKFTPYQTPLILKRGKGQYLWDELDNKLIDLLGMNVCISVGHANDVVNRAAREQTESLVHCTTMFHHPVPAHYGEELTETLPAGYEWVSHFTNSGAEAIDLALMMARTYTGNRDIVSMQSGYHGPTFGAQSVTGISDFRHEASLLAGVQFAVTPNRYRGPFGSDTGRYLESLEDTIKFGTTGKLAGMLVEPVQGYGGLVEMLPGYLSGAAEKIRSCGGLMIIDEVQSGVARTGKSFWAFEQHDIVPDIIVMAKGIGNGYPLGAVVTRREFAEPMGDKFLFHTYGSNPVSCAAGRAVLKVIKEDKLQENALLVGQQLLEGFERLKAKYPIIGDVRGFGLMVGMELVKDRKTKEPATDETAVIFEETRRQGIVVSKSGAYRSVLRLVPPLCLSEDDVETVVDAMDKSIGSLY